MVSVLAKWRAAAAHREGGALSDVGDAEGALAAYHRALELDPERPTTHYNIGLIHKYLGDWPRSLAHNQRAFELRPDDEATCWNLAIAATALGDWETAHRAWARVGVQVPDLATAEPDGGTTVVRLNPEGGGETVWCTPIDPVRARIDNIPFAGSGFRHGDIVLHDGAPEGQRVSDGWTYSVFNVLALLKPSERQTWAATIRAPSEPDVRLLIEACAQAGLAAEDWTSSVRYLCKACSEGRPHESHDTDLAEHAAWVRERDVGIAAPSQDALRGVLDAWLSGPGRELVSLEAPPED